MTVLSGITGELSVWLKPMSTREYRYGFREWAKAHRIYLSVLPQPKGWG